MGVKMRVGRRGHERICEAIVVVLRRVREQVVDSGQQGAQAIS
jgi:hypothetical protein